MEPDVTRLEKSPPPAATDATAMNPASAIQLAQSLGGVHGKLYLVGCEPDLLEDKNDGMALSPRVHDAIPGALAMIESLVEDLLGIERAQACN
jgi:Ni,Fe-hydrogenase maturation factor